MLTYTVYRLSRLIAVFYFIMVDTILGNKYLWTCFQDRKNKGNIK